MKRFIFLFVISLNSTLFCNAQPFVEESKIYDWILKDFIQEERLLTLAFEPSKANDTMLVAHRDYLDIDTTGLGILLLDSATLYHRIDTVSVNVLYVSEIQRYESHHIVSIILYRGAKRNNRVYMGRSMSGFYKIKRSFPVGWYYVKRLGFGH